MSENDLRLWAHMELTRDLQNREK